MGTSKTPGLRTSPLIPTNLMPGLVSDVENAFVRAGNETANDHPFDEQMRQVLHDEAILDRSRLALIGVADYVLFIVGTIADYLPFVSGGESGSAHTAQAARF